MLVRGKHTRSRRRGRNSYCTSFKQTSSLLGRRKGTSLSMGRDDIEPKKSYLQRRQGRAMVLGRGRTSDERGTGQLHWRMVPSYSNSDIWTQASSFERSPTRGGGKLQGVYQRHLPFLCSIIARKTLLEAAVVSCIDHLMSSTVESTGLTVE